MASDDPNYNALHQTNVGCFGLFECVNDPAVAAALFEAADKWLRAKGRSEIMGPIDYSTNYVCALLIDGFEYPPMLLTSHNPPYYASLIEGARVREGDGLVCLVVFRSGGGGCSFAPDRGPFFKRATVTIRPVNMKKLGEESARLREIYNQAWKKNWGFVPFTAAEFDHLVKELKPLAVPEIVLIAEVEGEPAGFILCVPDINAAFKKINGRLTSSDFQSAWQNCSTTRAGLRTARLVALGVEPKFAADGIAEMLVLRIVEEGHGQARLHRRTQHDLENNHLINRFLTAIGAKRYKTYRIYRKAISGSGT